jgi:hypothetical protein
LFGRPDDRDLDIDGDGLLNDEDACVYSPPGEPVSLFGSPKGDMDLDCDVDLEDYGYFRWCLEIMGELRNPIVDACLDIDDSNGDGRMDLRDFAAFQETFAGV